MPGQVSSPVNTLDNLKRHKRFKHLSCYSIECMSKAISPPSRDWEKNLNSLNGIDAILTINCILKQYLGRLEILESCLEFLAKLSVLEMNVKLVIENSTIQIILQSLLESANVVSHATEIRILNIVFSFMIKSDFGDHSCGLDIITSIICFFHSKKSRSDYDDYSIYDSEFKDSHLHSLYKTFLYTEELYHIICKISKKMCMENNENNILGDNIKNNSMRQIVKIGNTSTHTPKALSLDCLELSTSHSPTYLNNPKTNIVSTIISRIERKISIKDIHSTSGYSNNHRRALSESSRTFKNNKMSVSSPSVLSILTNACISNIKSSITSCCNNESDIFINVATPVKICPLHRLLTYLEKQQLQVIDNVSLISPSLVNDISVEDLFGDINRLCHDLTLFTTGDSLPLQDMTNEIGNPMAAEGLRVATILNNFSILLLAKGGLLAGEMLCIRALELRQKFLSPSDIGISQSMNNLAGFYKRRSQYKEAEELYRQVLDRWQRHYNEQSSSYIASCLGNLATVVHLQGRLVDAWSLYTRAIAYYGTLPETSDTESRVCGLLNCLAEVLEDLGEFQQACQTRQWVLDLLISSSKNGITSYSDIITCMIQIAFLYEKNDNISEAIKTYYQCLDIQQQYFGPDHVDVGYTCYLIGIILFEYGDRYSASLYLEEALRIYQLTQGTGHAIVTECQFLLSETSAVSVSL